MVTGLPCHYGTNGPMIQRSKSFQDAIGPMITRVALFLLVAGPLRAQTIPGAVLAKQEPHHHLAYEDSTLRVLRVRVGPHDTTLLHEHDPDYFWVALGASTVINAKLGSSDGAITSKDLSIHYSFGPFAHVARNPGDVPFDNITVELLQPQTDVRNLCEEAVVGKPLDCPAKVERGNSDAYFSKVADHPAFATDRFRVSLVTLNPGEVLRSASKAQNAWVIALDTADVRRSLVIDGTGSAAAWSGGAFHATGAKAWGIRNIGRSATRVVAVVELSRAAQ